MPPRSPVAEFQAIIFQPRDGRTIPVQRSFTQNRIMAPPVKGDEQTTVGEDLDEAAGLHELAVQLFGLGLVEPFQLVSEPAITTIAITVKMTSRSTFKRT